MSKHSAAFDQTRITVHPDICNGKPAVRDTRVAVETVLGFLSAGDTAEDILAQYPHLEAEDIAACLRFAADLAGHRFTLAKPA